MLRQLWQRLSRSPEDSPLQRRVDRIESAILACLVVVFLVAAPLLCIAAVRVAVESVQPATRPLRLDVLSRIGGTVELVSEVGQGTTVTFRLPRKRG